MIPQYFFRLYVSTVVVVLIGIFGCERATDMLQPASYPTNPEVFLDDFSSGLNYAAFGGSKVDAFDVDLSDTYKGSKSMRIAVPNADDPEGAYAGGTFFTDIGRDLTGYDALTFWAKASKGATLDLVGIGNDLTGTSRFIATRSALLLNTNWKKYYIPIPDPSKLKAERGLFFYSEGPENNYGYTIWFDEVQFEKLGTFAHPRPAILEEQNQIISAKVGDNLPIGGTFVIFNMPDGIDKRTDAAPAYFTYISSDPGVATVNEDGVVTAVGMGSATVKAKLGNVDATGSLTVNVAEAPPEPTDPAPTPTVPAGSVISLFSNAYSNVTVDTWSADWDLADVADVQIAGNDTKLYTNLAFAGIEFLSQEIDATSMTHFHMDIWTPDPTAAPAVFKIKLVNDVSGSISEHELTFSESSNPPLVSSNWVSFDIPLSDFVNLTGRNKLGQLIISGDPNSVYVDNIYFYNSGGNPLEPTIAAPTPAVPSGNVISMFSNAYTNVPVDSWSADWDQADVADIQIAGNDTKLYTNLVFAGIEFLTQTIDATAMTHFHMDFWTPDPTTAPAVFKIKLVDFGADGAFGGGDDVEHEIILDESTTPAIATGTWVGLDIPLSAFTGLTTRGHLAQMILSGDPNTVYVDNIYFYQSSLAEPTAPAPAPTFSSGDVISLFSDAYNNVAVDTWSADWDNADVADVAIAGDSVKLYTNLVFAGIEFITQTIDASAMTHFHMDMWTPDPTATPAIFKIKLVDFGADGAYGGGDDVEHEITLNQSSTPAIATGTWVNLDIPFSEFTGLTTRSHLAQLIISGDPNTVYIDNILVHR